MHCRRPLQSPRKRYVREGHPEQRADTLRDRGRDERARQPRAQLSAPLERRAHDRMPLILAPSDYARWLSDEPNPRDLMRPFPAEPMRIWPISTRVNKPETDDPSIIEPIELNKTAV